MMTGPENPDPINANNPGGQEGLSGGAVPASLEVAAVRGLPRGFLFARLAVLVGVMSAAGWLAWVWNGKHHGGEGAQLALFSMLSCTVSAGTALLMVGVTAGGANAFAGMLSSILFRTLGPLAAGAAWQVSHPEWPTDNLIQIHIPMFFVSLTVETILVVDIVSSSSQSKFAPGKGRAPRNMHG